MTKNKIILGSLIVLVFAISSFNVIAEQQLKTNRILVNPYYTENLDDGTVYDYTVDVNAPDGIQDVVSAIFTFKVYISPTTRFTMTVDGQSCVPPTFLVHTTYANAHLGEISFDCSNIITTEGVYDITMETDDNTGAFWGWLDLSYISQKVMSAHVFGTEYNPGQNGTVFIQLLDDQKHPINDAACYLTAYYPDKSNLYDDVLMTYLTNSDGLYYYDLIIPSQLGVYMLSAGCNIPGDAWIDDFIDYTYIGSYENVSVQDSNIVLLNQVSLPDNQQDTSGSGGTDMTDNIMLFHMDNKSDYGENSTYIYDFSGVGNNASCSSPSCPTNTIGYIENGYSFDGSNDYFEVDNDQLFNTSDGMTFTLWTKPEGTYTQWMIPLAKGNSGWGDWSIGMNIDDGWALFKNTNASGSSTYLGHYGASLYDIGEWVFVAGTYDTSSGNMTLYIGNESSSDLFSKSTTMVGPMFYNSSTSVKLGIIELTDKYFEGVIDEVSVWNRSLTDDEINTVFTNSNGVATNNGWIESVPLDLSNSSWVYYLSDYETNDGSLTFSILNESGDTICSSLGNIGSCAGNTSPIILQANLSMPTPQNQTPKIDSWSVTWSLDGIQFQEVKGSGELHVTEAFEINASEIAEETWNHDTRTLTSFDFTVNINDTALTELLNEINQTLFNRIEDVLNSVNNLANISADEIWNYSDRQLTEFNFVVDINDTDILQAITDSENNIITVVNNHNNTVMNKLYSLQDDIGGLENLTAQGVWSYFNRTLTSFDFDVSFNDTAILQAISDSNTSLHDKLDNINSTIMSELYDLRSALPGLIWSYSNRTLTFYPDQQEIDYSLMQEYLWNYTTRELTGFSFVVNINSTDILNAINGLENTSVSEIWSYSNRTLTFYPPGTTVDYDYIFDGVWNYTNRSLSEFGFVVNINDTNLENLINGLENLTAQDVWLYNNRTLTYYPPQVDMTDYEYIRDLVWNHTSRTLTSFNFEVEINDTDILNAINSLNDLNASGVWSYFNRTLTYYPAQQDLTNYTAIFEGVWDYSNRTLSEFSFVVDVNNTDVLNAINSLTNLTAEQVWSYYNRTLTFYPSGQVIDYDYIQAMVWNYTNRSLSEFNFVVEINDTNLVNLINGLENLTAAGVWSYSNRTLTYYPTQQDLTNYTAIFEGVWQYSDRQLTSFNFVVDINDTNLETLINGLENLSASGVWNYFNRTLTFYPSQTDLTNYDYIFTGVWNFSNRTLSEFGFTVNINDTDILNSIDGLANTTAQDVWTYSNRTLTYYPDLTNYEYIRDLVWNSTNRTLTDFDFVVEINDTALTALLLGINSSIHSSLDDLNTLIQNVDTHVLGLSNTTAQEIWEYNNRTLTDFNFTIEVNNSEILGWIQDSNQSILDRVDAHNDTVMNKLYLLQDDIAALPTATANATWLFENRTLTSFDFVVDINNALMAEYVWNYSNRSLTNFSFIVDINETVNSLSNFKEVKFTGGTEYLPGQNATVMAQLTETVSGDPQPINDANCTLDVYWPNSTLWLNDTNMTYLTDSNGIYFATIQLENEIGVYIADIYCLSGGNATYGSDTFHVSTGETTTIVEDGLLTFAELMPTVSAMAPTSRVCIDNMTMREITEFNATTGTNVTTYIVDQIVNCPNGCLNGTEIEYGATCAGTSIKCRTEVLDFFQGIPQFYWGIGAILMLVGVGLIVENLIRKGERKEKEMYGEDRPNERQGFYD